MTLGKKNPNGNEKVSTFEIYTLSKHILCDFAYITILIFKFSFYAINTKGENKKR